MKYHRIRDAVIGLDDGEHPQTTEGQVLLGVLEAHPPNPSDPYKRALPFQPVSYRDFMLFEEHYYGVAFGLTKLFMPFTNLLARIWATFATSKFPPFRPAKLWFKQPIFYQSNHLGFYSDGAPIHYPGYCTYMDVELELGIILGKPLFNATADEALDAIAGFCVFNDFSVRNGQMQEMSSGFGPQHSKSFANSISSTVVSADEVLPRLNDLRGRVTLNGRVVAEPKVGNWQFTVAEAIAHVSKSTRLYPGEFFGTGTFPSGAGIEYAAFQLRVGDTVTLEIDGIGSVTNTIISES